MLTSTVWIFLVCVWMHFVAKSQQKQLCQKLQQFGGDTLENKIILSPLIIRGISKMTIPLDASNYRLPIEVKTILKGSLGEWTKMSILVEPFSINVTNGDLCSFRTVLQMEQIYFLQEISSKNGAFQNLFNSESVETNKIQMISSFNFSALVSIPVLQIIRQDQSGFSDVFDCVSDSLPSSTITWSKLKTVGKMNTKQIKNGARLKMQTVAEENNGVYECKGVNILGQTTISLVYHGKVLKPKEDLNRCSADDSGLCSGHGKCYEDKMAKFCRCDEQYFGANCSETFKASDDLIRTPEDDKRLCNNNGKSFKSKKHMKSFCICSDEYFDSKCSITLKQEMLMKAAADTNAKFCSGNGQAYQKMNSKTIICLCSKNFYGDQCQSMSELKAEPGLRAISNADFLNISVKIFVTGALIVLAGVIIVVVILVVSWKCYFRRNMRRTLGEMESDQSNKPSQDIRIGTNTSPKGAPKMDESDYLINYPEMNKSTSMPPKNSFSDYRRNNHSLSIDGNYDNLPMPTGTPSTYRNPVLRVP